MALKEIRTLDDIAKAIIRRAKLDDTDAVREDLYEKINTKYQQIGYKEFYRWSGVTRPFVLKAKYATGTLTATSGSETITGASTVWTQAAHEGCRIQIGAAPNPYKILRVASTTSAVLDAPYIGDTTAGLTYTIFKDEYGLFPDLQHLRRFRIPGLSGVRRIDPVGPDEFDRYRNGKPFFGGLPKYYTVDGYNIYSAVTWADFKINTDFWEDDYDARPRNHNLKIWPAIFDTDRIAQIRYTMALPPMGRLTEEPYMPQENRGVLVYGVLLEHYAQGRDSATKREWKSEYEAVLSAMAADVDTTDDELVLNVDRERNRHTASVDFLEDVDIDA